MNVLTQALNAAFGTSSTFSLALIDGPTELRPCDFELSVRHRSNAVSSDIGWIDVLVIVKTSNGREGKVRLKDTGGLFGLQGFEKNHKIDLSKKNSSKAQKALEAFAKGQLSAYVKVLEDSNHWFSCNVASKVEITPSGATFKRTVLSKKEVVVETTSTYT